MTPNFTKWLGLMGISILLSACGADSNNETNSPEARQASVAMQYEMTGLLAQTVTTPQSRSIGSRAFNSEQILRGELSATAIDGNNAGSVEAFAWTIYLDETTFEASSNATLDLVPGNYDFELLVMKGNQQYASYSNQTVVDGTNDINMTIKPVIGDEVSNVTIIDQLAHFKFKYSADELAALTAPNMGIQVDTNAEQVFTINKETGLSDAFVNLSIGQHDLFLKLYDAAVQVGKSVVAQQSQTVAFGVDLAMDIVPLHAETQFVLTEDGGDANVSITLPADVVNEVGGLSNLDAALALVGAKNPLQESALNFIEQGDGSFKADLILTDLQYEDVTLSLTFADKTTSDQVASCNNTWILNDLSQTFNCNITLIRRAVVSGNILAVVGLTVMNDSGEPVSGAVITNLAGDNLGITGSGTYGTAGYLKLYIKAGDYEITATDASNNLTVTQSISLSPLEVKNLLLVLPQSLAGADPDCANCVGYVVNDIKRFEDGNTVNQLSNGNLLVTGSSAGNGEQREFTLLNFDRNGNLDATFGSAGMAFHDLGPVANHSVRSIKELANGKLLVASSVSLDGSYRMDLLVARFNADGSIDSSFADNGISTIVVPFAYTSANGKVEMEALNSGKIAVSTGMFDSVSGETYITVALLNEDGSIDLGFDDDGFAQLPWQTVAGIHDLKNGNFIVTGNFPGNGQRLARFNVDGTLDSSFGSSGVVSTSISKSSVQTSLVQTDGKIVLTGTTYDYPRGTFAVRFNVDGSVDTSFGVNGVANTYLSDSSEYAQMEAVVQQADGKVVMGGYIQWSDSMSMDQFSDVILIRYNTDGSLDTSFVGDAALADGTVRTSIANYTSVKSMALQINGKIVVTGTQQTVDYSYNIITVRFNSDGTLDTDKFGPAN